MFSFYLMYFQGIPRPLPINKNKVNRDSFINDEDDVMRESFNVSKSKSIEDTDEFRKAVESFDQMFGGEASGCPTPDVKRISMMESRKSSETPASPNLNWKRIKTGKSFEAEETCSSQHQESFRSSCNVETMEESVTTQSFQCEQKMIEEHCHVVQEQFESYSEQRQESHCQEKSISTSVTATTRQESSSSSSQKKKSKKNRKKSREIVVEKAEDVQPAPELSDKKKLDEKNNSDINDVIDCEVVREHKISLIGEHYKGEEENVIDAESIKNVDGTAKQRKGSSKFSKKQRDKSRSPSRSNRNSLHKEGFEDVDMSLEDVPCQEGVLS